jgi:hypothetical protein
MQPFTQTYAFLGNSAYTQNLLAPYPALPTHTSDQSTPTFTSTMRKTLLSSSTTETQQSALIITQPCSTLTGATNQSTPTLTSTMSKTLLSSPSAEIHQSALIDTQPGSPLTGASLNATAQPATYEHTVHGKTVTVSTSTVTKNISEFTGDHRFPPIRPPINLETAERRSRPDQTVLLSRALATWTDTSSPSSISEDVIRASMNNMFQLLDSPTVATNSITSRQLEPHVTPKVAPTVLDPFPFRDPEHECHSVSTDDGQPSDTSPCITRFLTNQEANRMWKLTTAQDIQTPLHRQTTSETQVLGLQSIDALHKHSTGIGPVTTSFPRANPTVTPLPIVRYASDSVVQTPAGILTTRQEFPKLTNDTPQDLRLLEFVLDHNLDPGLGLRDHWVHATISRVLTMADPLALRMQPARPRFQSEDIPRKLLSICDAPTYTDERSERERVMTSGIIGLQVQRFSSNEPAGAPHHPTTSTLGLTSGGAATSAIAGTSLTFNPSSAGPSTTDVPVTRAKRGRGRQRSTTNSPPSSLDTTGEPNLHGVQLDSSSREHMAGTFPGDEITWDLDCLTVGKSAARTTVHASPVSVSDACIIAAELPLSAQVQVPEEGGKCIKTPACPCSSAREVLENAHTLSQRIEFSDRSSQETLFEAPPRVDIWIAITRNGRRVTDRSSLQLPSSSDHRGGKANSKGTAHWFANLGPTGTVSVRVTGVAPPTEDTQVTLVSHLNDPALGHTRHRIRHRFRGSHAKPPTVVQGTAVHAAMSQVAPAQLQYMEPNTQSWGDRKERRRRTVGSPSRSDSLMDTGLSPALTATSSSSMYPPECLREKTSGMPQSTADALPSTEVLKDMVVNLHPDCPGSNIHCSVLRQEVDSPAKSLVGDHLGESTRPSPVPASIEVSLEKGGKWYIVKVLETDWTEAFQLNMCAHPDFAVCLAWRRHVRTQLGHSNYRQPTIRLVSHEFLDLPLRSWPTSWDCLVEHVRKGGSFRSVAVLRGGMNQEMQELLQNTVFDEHLPWELIDRDLVVVRSGAPVPADKVTDTMRLAQALASRIALQQWRPLETLLISRRGEQVEWVLTPARLAALSVITSRRLARDTGPGGQPNPWWTTGTYVEIRINHLSPEDFAPDSQLASNLRGQVQDGIVSRLLGLIPAISHHGNFSLQDLREDIRPELSVKDPGLFSASLVIPNGPWITGLLDGTVSFGGQSFCTLVPTDLFVETELSNVDQHAIRAIQGALGVDRALFREMLDESLGRALRTTDGSVRSREATVRYVLGNGGRGGKRTMEHLSPDSPESRLMVTMDGTNLLVTRRTQTVIHLPLGKGGEFPVTISLTLPQCPQQALRSMLQVREPATIRLRPPGSVIDNQIILAGPLPRGSIPEHIVNSGAKLAELRRDMHNVCLARIGTSAVRLVGKYDKGCCPMFLYLEFPSVLAAQQFASAADQGAIPQEVQTMLNRLIGGNVANLYTCQVPAEVFAGVDEKTLRALISHATAHPCTVAVGAGAAAGAPDNPGAAQH